MSILTGLQILVLVLIGLVTRFGSSNLPDKVAGLQHRHGGLEYRLSEDQTISPSLAS